MNSTTEFIFDKAALLRQSLRKQTASELEIDLFCNLTKNKLQQARSYFLTLCNLKLFKYFKISSNAREYYNTKKRDSLAKLLGQVIPWLVQFRFNHVDAPSDA